MPARAALAVRLLRGAQWKEHFAPFRKYILSKLGLQVAEGVSAIFSPTQMAVQVQRFGFWDDWGILRSIRDVRRGMKL